MGYAGLEPGIDDPSFVPVLKALAQAKLPILIHPNYGLLKDVFGPCFGSHGQVLPVSLGFTTGTTIAFTRMYLANISDLLPILQIVLLHAGDTLPSVLGRIETCIANDRIWQPRLTANTSRTSLRDVLKRNVNLDGIMFDCRALRAAVEAIGIDRVMFGTDHLLSPSLRTGGK